MPVSSPTTTRSRTAKITMASVAGTAAIALAVFLVADPGGGGGGGVPPPAPTVSVPLTVEELLPSGISGFNRTNELVSFGIPLKQADNITSPQQLTLTGAGAAQFRVIRRWPNNAIQWVLVDTQMSLTAGQKKNLTLTNGTGNFPSTNLASETSSTITVSTGDSAQPTQFTIRKTGFNGLDTVAVNNQQLLTTGPKDGVWSIDQTGTRYTSANDTASTVRIEENGPVRVQVRADGSLTSTTGTKHLDYTLRMHFVKGSRRVKMDLTVRNAQSGTLGKKQVAGLGVQIPTALTTTPQFIFPTNDGTFTGTLGTTPAYLFQAYARNQIEGDYGNVIGPTVGSQQGVEVKNGSTTLHALGNQLHWGTGWARLTDQNGTGKSVTVAMNHLSEFWPGGFEFAPNGKVDIQLYSTHNAANPLSFTWGAHDTRTLAVEFHPTAPAPTDATTLTAIQYPLFARATDYAHYGATGAVFGSTKLVTETEFNQFITATDQAFGQSVTCAPLRASLLANENKSTVWRAKDWGRTGGPNQLDKSVSYFLDYLRTGKGGFFLRAFEESRYKADQAAVHCDNCDLQAQWPNENPNNWPWGDKTNGFNGGGISGNTFESNRNHPHWPSTLMAWFLTGDQKFYDDTREIADYLALRENGSYGARNRVVAVNGFGSGGLRGWPNALRDHALFAEYLNVQREWDAVRFMSGQLVNSTDGGACSEVTMSDGWNRDRGFVYSQSHMACADGRGNSFYHQHFLPLGIAEARRVLGTSSTPTDVTLANQLSDVYLGQAQFITSEIDKYARVAGNGSLDGWRTPYRISYEFPNPVTTAAGTETYHRADYYPSQYSWAYEQTGNALFLEAGQGMFCRMMQYEPYERGSDLSSQEFIWTWLRRNQVSGGTLTPTAQSLGNNQWRLTWAAPANAVSYELRASNKPIVEHSFFDEQRTDVNALYLYPPTTHTPLWKATRLSGAPATPKPAGQTEDVTVTAPTGTTQFQVQYKRTNAPTDATAPTISNLQPSAPVQFGSSFRFGLDTNEPATCKYGTSTGQGYELKPNYFRFTGTKIHRSSSLPTLARGTYTYYVRCKDAAGNISPGDTTLTFTVQ